MTQKLLTPVQMGSVTLSNRIVMAPLTRSRAEQPGDIPGDLNVAYYAQRASAGLIVSEASQVSQQGQGYAWTPGMYTDAQEAGWKEIVDAVHAQGGRMSAQLWHVGRVSHPLLQENGAAPVAPSAIIAANAKCFPVQPDGSASFVPCGQPRALATEEIPGIVAQYRQAAARAKRAGFDFVEVHSANGYLLHQFLATNTNQRTDQYGGSIHNRARLLLEVLDAVIDVMGDAHVGVRLSPYFTANDINDAETEQMALYLAEEFSRRDIAYLHIAEAGWAGGLALSNDFRRQLRAAFTGKLIFCGEYTAEKAEKSISDGLCDAVAFGRPFIANPDLVERFRKNAPLNTADPHTYYGGGATGYTDYPLLSSKK